tara:strand:- start:25077 stop:26051 length:975 start_codon:yes stop_codon:yes gene_type:complete
VNDKETIINKFEKAPLMELSNFRRPENSSSFYVKTFDDKKIRVAIWNKESVKGTILLQSGRTEFIEKYYEVILEFIERDYCVACMDWRGQGLSSRNSKNVRIGHIDSFKIYDKDFIQIIDEIYENLCPKPWIGFGHSMGGCLLASYLLGERNKLDKTIFCAPMISIRANKMSRLIIKLFGILSLFRKKDLPFQKPIWDEKIGWLDEPFEGNALTSDKKRFKRSVEMIQEYPDLGVKGISVGWLIEALARTDYLCQLNWQEKFRKPILLLNATNDKLVNSTKNKELISKVDLAIIKDLESEHEIMMEVDFIRKQAWEAIDAFLKN